MYLVVKTLHKKVQLVIFFCFCFAIILIYCIIRLLNLAVCFTSLDYASVPAVGNTSLHPK